MSEISISVVVPLVERSIELLRTNQQYIEQVQAYGESYEFIYVVDESVPEVVALLSETAEQHGNCHVIHLPKRFGDATALATGLEHAQGKYILILPPYEQIDARDIGRVLDSLQTYDVVIAERDRAKDSLLNKLQASAFNFLSNRVSNIGVADTTSEVRAIRKYVVEEIDLYGDMHRFLPHLAYRLGFRIGSVLVRQAQHDTKRKLYNPGTYARRVLDLLTAMFLLRFTKKPLRFFGLIGLGFTFIGIAIVGWVVVERMFFEVGLSDRPALFLGALAIVLGLQVVAIGLVGEIVIFSHAREHSEYRVREIIGYQNAVEATPEPQQPESSAHARMPNISRS